MFWNRFSRAMTFFLLQTVVTSGDNEGVKMGTWINFYFTIISKYYTYQMKMTLISPEYWENDQATRLHQTFNFFFFFCIFSEYENIVSINLIDI